MHNAPIINQGTELYLRYTLNTAHVPFSRIMWILHWHC